VRCVACALEKEYFNKQALIFVQETQHGGKTTLTRFLIPKDLTAYYTENISVDKVLFNKASTGRVSGITYLVPGFKIRGQALGNQFKFGSITKQINYEQNRDGKIISQANSRTREKFGSGTKEGFSTNISGIGIPYSKQWYHYVQQLEAFTKYLEYHSGLIIQTRQENSNLIKEVKAIKMAQKRIRFILTLTILTIAVPLSAFLVSWLIYWIFR
jgi:hypothetical protein